MADPDYITKVRELLREGKPQAADDLLSEVQRTRGDPSVLVAATPAEPPPPRAPQVVLHDLLSLIVAHLGNRPELELLLEEYIEATH